MSIKTVLANNSPRDLIDIINRDGGVIIENALNMEDLLKLDKDTKNILNNTEDCKGYFYGFSTKRIACMVSKSEICQKMAINTNILKVMDHFLLPNCSDYQLNLSQLISIGAGEKKQITHTDDPMFPFEHNTDITIMVNVMWAIDDFTEENGATYAAVGSHLWPRDRQPKKEEMVQAVMKRGSCFIWLGSTMHGGGANNTLVSRRGIVMSYNLGWLKQADNYFLSVPIDTVKEYSPSLQKLLGYFVHKPNLNMVEGRDPIEMLSTKGLGKQFTEYMPEGLEDILAEHYHTQEGFVSEVKFG